MLPNNDNDEPIVQARNTLADLYHLRREILKEDVRGLSLERRRRREEALAAFERGEAALLAVLPLA